MPWTPNQPLHRTRPATSVLGVRSSPTRAGAAELGRSAAQAERCCWDQCRGCHSGMARTGCLSWSGSEERGVRGSGSITQRAWAADVMSVRHGRTRRCSGPRGLERCRRWFRVSHCAWCPAGPLSLTVRPARARSSEPMTGSVARAAGGGPRRPGRGGRRGRSGAGRWPGAAVAGRTRWCVVKRAFLTPISGRTGCGS